MRTASSETAGALVTRTRLKQPYCDASVVVTSWGAVFPPSCSEAVPLEIFFAGACGGGFSLDVFFRDRKGFIRNSASFSLRRPYLEMIPYATARPGPCPG